MWFLFGLFSTLTCAVSAGYWRWATPWGGEHVTRDDGTFEYCLLKNKNSVTGVRVAVACPPGFDFKVRRESTIDGIFVDLGLAREQTAGDLVFDDAVYLLSDDVRVGSLVRNSQVFRDAIFRLLHEFEHTATVKYLRCVRGRLWVECKPPSGAPNTWGLATAHALYPSLKIAADELESRPAPLGPPARDKHAFAAAALLAASSGLCINAVVQLARLWIRKFPIVLDSGQLFGLALTVGLLLTVLMLALAVAMLRKTSRAHTVALEILLMGTLGAIGTSYAELSDLNIEADSAPAEPVDVLLVDRVSYRCGRRNRSTCYRIDIAGFDGVEPRSLEVSEGDYARVGNADKVRLTVHEGALGVRWLERIDPAP